MTAATMRAVQQDRFGGPEVLKVVEVERPALRLNDVLLRVVAAGVNPIDAHVRAGTIPLLGRPPFTVGWDVSGVVEQVAPGVTRFTTGDEVYGMPLIPRAANGYAEYVAVPSRQLARKPAELTHEQAAGLPLAGLTAWQALIEAGQLEKGQRVLIHAGGGGVGHLAIQIARARGAEVITTASAAKHEFVRDLGAHQVIDYRTVDFRNEVSDVDLVLETVGGDVAVRSLEVLRPGGTLVTIVDMRDTRLAERVTEAGRRFAGVTAEPDHAVLGQLTELVTSGQLRVHLGHALPLDRVAEAHHLIDGGSTAGKIVLTM